MGVFMMTLLLLTGIFLMIVVLLQRGRGGGLAGAFGGAGGQSVLGVKAGDVFTKITVGVAVAWVILAGVSGLVLRGEADQRDKEIAEGTELVGSDQDQDGDGQDKSGTESESGIQIPDAGIDDPTKSPFETDGAAPDKSGSAIEPASDDAGAGTSTSPPPSDSGETPQESGEGEAGGGSAGESKSGESAADSDTDSADDGKSDAAEAGAAEAGAAEATPDSSDE